MPVIKLSSARSHLARLDGHPVRLRDKNKVLYTSFACRLVMEAGQVPRDAAVVRLSEDHSRRAVAVAIACAAMVQHDRRTEVRGTFDSLLADLEGTATNLLLNENLPLPSHPVYRTAMLAYEHPESDEALFEAIGERGYRDPDLLRTMITSGTSALNSGLL